jgi:hypothetical protein
MKQKQQDYSRSAPLNTMFAARTYPQVLLQNQLIFYCIAIRLMWLPTIYLFILLFPLIILNQVMTESKKERRVWHDDLSTKSILSIAYAASSSLMFFVVTLRS